MLLGAIYAYVSEFVEDVKVYLPSVAKNKRLGMWHTALFTDSGYRWVPCA